MKIRWNLLAVVFLLAALSVEYDNGRFNLTAAHAQVAGVLTINWTPPTAYTDNFPLPEQDLDYYTFYCNGLSVKQFDSIIGTWTNDVDVSGLASGDYVCQLRVTDIVGTESGPSNDLNFTIGPRIPGNPANLTSS